MARSAKELDWTERRLESAGAALDLPALGIRLPLTHVRR
jgi:hypothetical protein